MKRRRIFHTAAMLATSLAAFGPNTIAKGVKETKKLRSGIERTTAEKRTATAGPEPPQRKATAAVEPKKKLPDSTVPNSKLLEKLLIPGASPVVDTSWIVPSGGKYPWKTKIVTTTFWIGENIAPNNPVANVSSSWDPKWSQNYGGIDTPKREERANYMPISFVPQQNPFYVALPYNDVTSKGYKPEASAMIPWFQEASTPEGRTTLKGRWIAIRFNGRVAYAQWEDCGPFRTDHSAYVFGTERPKPNLNKGAGLDVSPAVRDYLGMSDTDVTDWRFVDFDEIPRGPWSTYGENNTFVQREREKARPVVLTETIRPSGT